MPNLSLVTLSSVFEKDGFAGAYLSAYLVFDDHVYSSLFDIRPKPPSQSSLTLPYFPAVRHGRRGLSTVAIVANRISSPRKKSLLEFLDSSQLNCLNEHSDHGIKAILSSKSKNTTDAYLLSDADEQLLFTIPVRVAFRSDLCLADRVVTGQ